MRINKNKKIEEERIRNNWPAEHVPLVRIPVLTRELPLRIPGRPVKTVALLLDL